MKTTYFLLTLFIILSSYGIQAGVQYLDTPLCCVHDCRTMITTTYVGSSSMISGKTLKVSYDNSQGKVTYENTYTFTETTSRIMNASPTIGAKFLSQEVKASLGGETSYTRTETYRYSVKIPPGKIGRVYVTEKTTIANFRHVIQPQIREFGLNNWKADPNPGAPMRIEYSTVTTKSPEFSLEIN